MSFNNKNFQKKESVIKPVAILITIALVIGATYHFFGNKNQAAFEPEGNIDSQIAKWVKKNPEKILESLQEMHIKKSQKQNKDAAKNIKKKKDELFSKDSPQYAPKKYDITIVEFFDYNCGYCKKARETVDQLIEKDKKVRVIFKEYPILGQASTDLSNIALAVHLAYPKSYFKFHNALMKSSKRNKEGAYEIAKSIGLNIKKIKDSAAKNSDKISRIIAKNQNLGQSIGVTGTPGFIINEELLPGAYPLDTILEKINNARKNK